MYTPDAEEKKGYLFQLNLKKRISNRRIRNIVKIIGDGVPDMDVYSHTLRHSFAIHFLNSTDNLAKLKQFLGHSSIKSTGHYLKYTVKDIREAYTEAFRWRFCRKNLFNLSITTYFNAKVNL